MVRVLFFSDLHYSRNSDFEEQRWFPEIVSFLRLFSDKLARRFLNFCDNRYKPGISKLFQLASKEKYDFAVCLGDLTTGTLESGLASEKAKVEAKEINNKLSSLFKKKLYVVLGNHDLGFKGVIGYKKGDITQKSIDNALKIYKTKLFYSFSISGKRFVVINSSILSSRNKFSNLNKQQLDFLRKVFLENKKVFVLLHNPFSLYNKELRDVLAANINKIEAIIYGHAHSRAIGKLDTFFSSFYSKAVPLHSIDKGYSELIINDSKFEWKHVHWG